MYLLFSKVCTIEVGDDVSSIQSIPKKQQHKSTFPFFVLFPSPYSFHGNISLVNVITLPPAPTFLGKCSGEVRWWCWLSFCSSNEIGGVPQACCCCWWNYDNYFPLPLLLFANKRRGSFSAYSYMTTTASSWSKWGCLQIIIFILGIEDINNHKSSW